MVGFRDYGDGFQRHLPAKHASLHNAEDTSSSYGVPSFVIPDSKREMRGKPPMFLRVHRPSPEQRRGRSGA